MPKNPPELTAARLRELLSYDPDTGVFKRRISTSPRINVGDIAGSKDRKGYLRIRVDGGNQLKAHRLAWLYVYGRWPKEQIDHIDGDKANNRINNLREATNAENHQNRLPQKNNSSGYAGIGWHKREKKWQVRIKKDGRILHVGMYKEIEDAIAARTAAKAMNHSFQPFDRSR